MDYDDLETSLRICPFKQCDVWLDRLQTAILVGALIYLFVMLLAYINDKFINQNKDAKATL